MSVESGRLFWPRNDDVRKQPDLVDISSYSAQMKREEIYYQAMRARDHRFDGKFFVAVKTTGIYCRPICPAKPKRENVEFFPSHFEAEKNGYRPCLRCRPESAPQSPAWIGKSAIVQRAVKVLHNQETMTFNEDRFAEIFGVTARHLRRLFIEEVGKTPKQLSFENRLNLARKLITETSLPISEVAFASGFRSIRRFNDAFKDRFKKSPREIRRSPLSDGHVLKISLPYRPPFDFEGLLQSYQRHQVGDLEWFEPGQMHRVIAFNGVVGQITISNNPERSHLIVDIDFPDTSVIHVLIAKIRALFDLDSDPVIIANSLEEDKAMKSLLRKYPGIRMASGWDPFEIAVGTILGQLVSVSFGRTLVQNLIDLLGEDSGLERNGQPIKLFPSPEKIAQSDLKGLKTTTARKKALIAFARAVAENKISLASTQEVERFYQSVLSIPGIGPWTADYMSLKALRHTDAFPKTDLILARALKLHHPSVIEKMSPWRGYAAHLLWREYSSSLTNAKRKNP
jgi:AraC family transcriptional regulator of adaptative response / DNA-3-methyladenine glycosylase II